MKYTVALAPLALGLALAVSQPALAGKPTAHGACHKATPALLDSKFAEFNNAWATGNPATVTALFDDDAVLLATVANDPRTDHNGIQNYFAKFLKGKPSARIDTTTIKSGCNWALRMGTWTVNMTDQATGTPREVKARYSFLYQFEDGQWKIEHLHSSAMPEK